MKKIQMPRLRALVALGAAILLSSSLALAGNHDNGSLSPAAHWAGSWAAAGSTTGPFDAPVLPPSDQTLRQIVKLSAGGRSVRVRLSNVKGTAALRVGAASVGLRDAGAGVLPGSLRALTFGGEPGLTIAPGARVPSDPVELRVANRDELAISIYLPAGATELASPVTNHVRALQTNYLLAGDQTGSVDPQVNGTQTSWFYLTGVDVAVRGPMPVVAVIGDSIANGDTSTPDANRRWPDRVAERIFNGDDQRRGRHGGLRRAGILNLGISGNQVTATLIGDNAQARLDRDVLTQTGVTHVIIMEGINDLGLPGLVGLPPVSADDVIAGLAQLIERARARGLTVIGATVTPSGGFPLPAYNTPEADAKRQVINDWIRNSGAYDAVIDFDAVLRDPDSPNLIRADLTSDGLHPNDAGYQAMADAVPLGLLRDRRRRGDH